MKLMCPEELVVEELFTLCEQMDLDNIENSLPAICILAELFLNDNFLKSIAEIIWRTQQNDFAPLNSILEELSLKIFLICKELREYVEQHHITNPDIINRLPMLKEVICANAFWVQLFTLQTIFKVLLHDQSADHREFIKRHAIIDESNHLQPITFLINTDQFVAELNHLERIKTIREWYYLSQIISLSQIHNHKKYDEQKNDAYQHPINALILTTRYNALNRAIGSTKDPYFPEEGFNPREYHRYMQRLSFFVKKQLLNLASSQNSSDEKTIELDIFYDGDIGVLIINNHKIQFSPNDIEAHLLYEITPGGRPCPVPMQLNDIVDNIFNDQKNTKINRDKIYKAKDRINEKIKEFGIEKIILSKDPKNPKSRIAHILWNSEYIYNS